MTKILRGLRGVTTARANTSEAILQATAELLRALLEANGFQPEDVESAIFTSSPDLTAEYPARAARLLGWRDVPLLGAAEVPVPDGLPRCIRVLLHFYTTKPQRELKHIYLREAAKLRPTGRSDGRSAHDRARRRRFREGGRPVASRSSVDLPHRHLRRAARRGGDRDRRRPARPPPRPGALFTQVGDPAAAPDARRRAHRRRLVGRPHPYGRRPAVGHRRHRLSRGARRGRRAAVARGGPLRSLRRGPAPLRGAGAGPRGRGRWDSGRPRAGRRAAAQRRRD